MKRTIITLSIVIGIALSVAAIAQLAKEAETLFHRGVHFEEVRGELKEAIAIFEQIVKDYPENRAIAAKAYYHLGICYEKLGRTQAADAFQAIVEKYPDQTETVRLAREKLRLLAKPEPAVEEVTPELKISLVWQGPDMDPAGEISPDGKYLSYVDWPSGNLAIRETATGKVRRLTNKEGSPAGSEEFADWSLWAPDSRKIVYAWYSVNPNFYELRTVGLDNMTPQVLFRGDYNENFAHPWDWSPDGRYILAEISSSTQGANGLGLISIDDESVHLLPTGSKIFGNAKFSPDGRHIVFDHPQKTNAARRDLSVMSVDGKEEMDLIEHPSDDRLLGWAPGGGSILFLSDRTGTWDAWMIGIADGKSQGAPRLIKRELGRIKPMGLTRSGSFYYSTRGFEWDIFSTGLDPNSGKITDPPKKVPLLHEGRNTFPALSPDGKRLAYMSERPDIRDDVLCVYSFETGEILEIRPKGAFQRFVFPHWMPDGSSIIVSGEEMTRGRGFFKVDLQTGELTDFLNFNDVFGKDKAGFIRGIRIANDARTLYYLYHGPDQSCRVMTRRLDTKEEKEICRFPLDNPSDPNRLRLSPDETKLALALREGKDTVLKVFPAAGGEIREIFRTGQTGGFEGFVWSQDGRYIYFIKPVDPEHDQWKTELWRISSSGGNAENLGLISNRFVNLHFHPDGKRIFYASRTADEPGGAAIWAMENFLPAAEPKDILVRRLYQDIGTGIVGSPSPDGRSMSDIDRNTGNLVVRDLASGAVRAVTNVPGVWDEYALYSVFSADGKKLAYTWFNKEGKFEIRTIGLDGTEVRTVLGDVNAIDVGPLGWSSDGRTILAFIYKVGGISEIVLISVEDASSRTLKKFDGVPLGAARLSPDGRFVAYDRVTENPVRNSDIFLIPVAGGEDIPLVRHAAMDGLLGWTPDGKGLLFASDRTGSFDAWLVRVADGLALGDPVLVRKGLGEIEPLGFDRNGSFFYGIQAQVSDVFRAMLNVEAGKILSSPTTVSTRMVGSNDSPAWSPDGKILAYILRGAAASQSLLCLLSDDTGKEHDLEPKMYLRWPLWSPDGQKILVWGRKERTDYGFFFIDPQTGAVTPFVLDTKDYGVQQSTWSPDGKFIFFRRFSSDLKEGWFIRRHVETGKEIELLHNYPINDSAISPDGKKIFFRSYDEPDTTLKTMSTSGEDIHELVRVKAPDYIPGYSGLALTPDGRYVLYFTARADNQGVEKTSLWRVDVETGDSQSFNLTMDRMRNLTIHPDGKQIAFDSGMPRIEIWVMENFLNEK